MSRAHLALAFGLGDEAAAGGSPHVGAWRNVESDSGQFAAKTDVPVRGRNNAGFSSRVSGPATLAAHPESRVPSLKLPTRCA
jgi:hypothetical protein